MQNAYSELFSALLLKLNTNIKKCLLRYCKFHFVLLTRQNRICVCIEKNYAFVATHCLILMWCKIFLNLYQRRPEDEVPYSRKHKKIWCVDWNYVAWWHQKKVWKSSDCRSPFEMLLLGNFFFGWISFGCISFVLKTFWDWWTLGNWKVTLSPKSMKKIHVWSPFKKGWKKNMKSF